MPFFSTFPSSGGNTDNRKEFVVQATAPEDTSLVWFDTADNNIKIYDGTVWKPFGAVWS